MRHKEEVDVQEILQALIDANIASSDTINGVSDVEIRHLEKYIGRSLPQSFREYLNVMGNGAGNFQQGSHVDFSDLFWLTQQAKRELTKIDSDYPLPEDAFVFFGHQGYIFLYFRLSEGENPPVYSISTMEYEGKPEIWAPSFTQSLWQAVEEEISIRQRLSQFHNSATNDEN